MAKYKIEISKTAERFLKKIPKRDISKVIESIKGLEEVPLPQNCQKLSTIENIYRIRQGNYRIMYEFRQKYTIRILKIGHRKDVYRGIRFRLR